MDSETEKTTEETVCTLPAFEEFSYHDFSKEDDMTDVVFIVESKKIYFNRTVLAMCSPVFKQMFSSNFAEKNKKEIPLPGKTVNDMVTFLKQIHPVHSAKPLTSVSEKLLALANEYQVDHILLKCEQYIGTQIDTKGWLPTDEVLFYLQMCERYKLTKHRDVLLYMAADRETMELEKLSFDDLTESTKTELLKIRCVKLEKERDSAYADKVQMWRNIIRKKASMSTIPACWFATLPDKCIYGCYVCPHGKTISPFRGYGSREAEMCQKCLPRDCRIYSFCKRCIEDKAKRIAEY